MKSLLLLIILIHISCGNRNNHYSYKAQKKILKKKDIVLPPFEWYRIVIGVSICQRLTSGKHLMNLK